ncbi:YciI family protein [Leekyejoonella antrihumi]|uniref:Transcription initiation protein n=1 Tax=Leekyejoonella antrihumi TaxID=1660198 RepID=A0A563E9I9_9MICO|nr:YciI family protein [Leekyejoonella antrihumi]TWP38989.1 transcription initiation protein [Leekyejoonella antrihumi]
MSEYMVIIVGDADRWWTRMSAEERRQGYAEYGRFSQTLTERGHKIVGGAELHQTATAKHIAPGGTTVTDGPFAEGAEQVGGFFLVESDDLDSLLDCCTILTAIGEGIEVRPTVGPDERAS